MSKSLIKIIDAAIFPAALMIAAKFIGLYLVVEFFNLEWGVDNLPNQIFSSRPVFYTQDLQTASSYSDLFLIIVMITSFSYHVIRATFLHDTHIDPKVIARLAANGLLGLVKDSYEIYQKATIWLIFLWLSITTVIVNYFLDKTYLWIAILGVLTSIILTAMLLRDAAYEISLAKKKLTE